MNNIYERFPELKTLSLTKGRRKELERILWFYPKGLPTPRIEQWHVDTYFAKSEGRKTPIETGDQYIWRPKNDAPGFIHTGLDVLTEALRWQGITIGMWQEGILDGSVGYATLVEGTPTPIVEWRAGQLFKGIDKECILAHLNGTFEQYLLKNYQFYSNMPQTTQN